MADIQFTEWDLLKLHESFTLVEAACLIIGSIPVGLTKKQATNDDPHGMPSFGRWNEYGYNSEWVDDSQGRDSMLESVLRAIMKAVRDSKLESTYIPISNPRKDIDPWEIEVETDHLKKWLLSKNIRPVFFFGEQTKDPDYMNPSHHRYSAKLAAAVKVWLAMEDEELTRGKSTITAMEQWLESRYKELDLLHEGQINKTAFKECAKVANWNTKGGATKTPEPSNPPTP